MRLAREEIVPVLRLIACSKLKPAEFHPTPGQSSERKNPIVEAPHAPALFVDFLTLEPKQLCAAQQIAHRHCRGAGVPVHVTLRSSASESHVLDEVLHGIVVAH